MNKPSTRESILKAALECFNQIGFQATTIEEIRARSQASTGSIYHHFGGKEQLAASLYIEGLQSYQTGLIKELEEYKDAELGIKALVKYHLQWISKNADLARYIFHTRQAEFIGNQKATLKTMNKDSFQALSKWLKPHIKASKIKDLPNIKASKIKDLPMDVYLSILIGPSQEFSRHWLAGRVKTSLELASELLAEAAWKSIAY